MLRAKRSCAAATGCDVSCFFPLKGYKDPISGGWTSKRQPEKMAVACGSCLGCRIDHSRMWAMRAVHEAGLHEDSHGNCFLTLTYDDEHVPDHWNLHYEHVQGFLKRLRARYSDRRIKFLCCGEYGNVCPHGKVEACAGCGVGRPHYHLLLFNHRFEDAVPYGSRNGEQYFYSQKAEAIWGHGFVSVGELTFQSAAYVARYSLKKVNGDRAAEHYVRTTVDGELVRVKPEIFKMSTGRRKGEGIGAAWFQTYKEDFLPADKSPVPGRGTINKVPRYYEKIFAETDPELLERVKAERMAYKRKHPQEFTDERLRSKYLVKKDQVSMLKRGDL